MRKTLLYIIIRVVLLSVIFTVFAFIYKNYFWADELERENTLLPELLHNADSCDAFYFAESSNFSNSDKDSSREMISELIEEQLPGYKIFALNQAAAHAGIFFKLMKNIPDDARVKTLIITMNLRSFGAAWIHSQLNPALMKKNVLYRPNPPYVNKVMLNFGAYEHESSQQIEKALQEQWRNDVMVFPFDQPYKTVRTWDDAMALKVFYDSTGKADEKKTGLACHYIKSYAFQIDTNTNPRIKDFDNIVKFAKQKHLNLVFNLLPENMEEAEQLVGPALTFLMKQNRDLLINRYQKDGVIVVDNLEALPAIEFIDRDWTTEHYYYTGRKIVARNVAERLKQAGLVK